MPLPSAGCHFKQKLVFPKLVIQKKILPPVTSFDILKIVCQEAEKALVAKPCVLVQKRRAKLMESPKVVPSNQGGKRVTWLGKNPFHIPSLPFRLSPWLQ